MHLKFMWHSLNFDISALQKIKCKCLINCAKIFTIFRGREMYGIFDVQLAYNMTAAFLSLDRVSVQRGTRDARNTGRDTAQRVGR